MSNKSSDNKELVEFFNNMIDDNIERDILKILLEENINEEMIGDLLEIVESHDD